MTVEILKKYKFNRPRFYDWGESEVKNNYSEPVPVVFGFVPNWLDVKSEDYIDYIASEEEMYIMELLASGMQHIDNGINYFRQGAERLADNDFGRVWGIVIDEGETNSKVEFAKRLRDIESKLRDKDNIIEVKKRSKIDDETFVGYYGKFMQGLSRGIKNLETGEWV